MNQTIEVSLPKHDELITILERLIKKKDGVGTLLRLNLNKSRNFKKFLDEGGDVESYFKGYEEGILTAAFLIDLYR